MKIGIGPAKGITGNIVLPGDKSISHRAVMMGAIAKGSTVVKGLLDCDDCNRTIDAFRAMGIDIHNKLGHTTIEGKGLRGLKRPDKNINVGESGTTMRLLAGILSGQDFSVVLEADKALCLRPMKRIVEPLKLMGVDIRAAPGERAPLLIEGGSVSPIEYKLPVPSAQIKSAILFAGLYARGVTTVEEVFRSRDHTERMLKYFGANINVNGLKVSIKGGKELEARSFEIPGDISSASFFMAAAILLKGSRLSIQNVNINPTRAGVVDILKKMGARITVIERKEMFEPAGDIVVESGPTSGISIEEGDIPAIIDELPVIFALASLSKGRTVIKGAGELKVKETDRIKSMKDNLGRMGASISVEGGDIIIDGKPSLKGASFDSYGDHRTCMAMAVAALAADSPSEIEGAECVSKSFPEFFKVLESLRK